MGKSVKIRTPLAGLIGMMLLSACGQTTFVSPAALTRSVMFHTEDLKLTAKKLPSPVKRLALTKAAKAQTESNPLSMAVASALPQASPQLHPQLHSPTAAVRASLNTQLNGINYYPQQNPWNRFWTHYDAAAVTRDLSQVRQLGFNSVRIFVFYELFGGPDLKSEQMAYLQNFLNQAQSQGLKVVVTLFDQYQQYAPEHDRAAEAHLNHLYAAVGNHQALLAWDLKNESDLDYPANGTETVKNWVSRMASHLHKLDSQHPITASYADAAQMGSETESLDYLTFHYYGPEANFASTAASIKQRFGDKPAVLGEFGFHTWSDRPGDGHPPAHQYNYLNAILAGAAKAGLQGTIAWNLHDYPELSDVPVIRNQPVNRYLGLFDLQGQAKSGVLALNQPVRIIDADTQSAVSPDSRRLELVYASQHPGALDLKFQRQGQAERSLSFRSHTGLNSQTFSVNAAEIKDLLELRLQAVVSAPELEQAQTLILRRD